MSAIVRVRDSVVRFGCDSVYQNGGKQTRGRTLRQADDWYQDAYRELHSLAARYMRAERPDHTLRPTALINEAYLRMVDQTRATLNDRTHFLRVAALAMRRVLVDHAKQHQRKKRRNGLNRVNLTGCITEDGMHRVDFIALDEALDELAAIKPDHVHLIDLRYFGGLSVEESANALGISVSSAERWWRTARLWLFSKLRVRDTEAGESACHGD